MLEYGGNKILPAVPSCVIQIKSKSEKLIWLAALNTRDPEIIAVTLKII